MLMFWLTAFSFFCDRSRSTLSWSHLLEGSGGSWRAALLTTWRQWRRSLVSSLACWRTKTQSLQGYDANAANAKETSAADDEETPHPAGAHVHTLMHRHKHTRKYRSCCPLSLRSVLYVILPSLHTLSFFKIVRVCTSNGQPLQPDRGELPLNPPDVTQIVKKNHRTLPEMEILFTTVCAIVIKSVACGTFGIPSVMIGH